MTRKRRSTIVLPTIVLILVAALAAISHWREISAEDSDVTRTDTRPTDLAVAVALADEQPPSKTGAPERSYPSLPGSVGELPARIRKNAPFDVDSYYLRIPSEDNSAALYLDALYEFSPEEMSECVSPAERQARGAALKDRFRRTTELMQRDQATVNPAFRAGTVDEYRESFQKLVEAQKRKRCVFETGIGVDTVLVHAQAARQAVRLLDWRTEADLADERLADAVENVEIALRLSRDLRPRGPAICQLVSMALDSVVLSSFIPRILATAELERTHCDRLLQILSRHASEGADLLAVGFQGEYLTLRDLLDRVERNDPTIPKDISEQIRVPADPTTADFAAEVAALNRYFGPLVKPHDRGVRALVELQPEQVAALEDIRILGEVMPAVRQIVEAVCRQRTRLGATRCLVALRRWKIDNGNDLPVDLIQVCRAAGMKAIPLDAFSRADKPLRFAMVGGEFVIYSVAPDGKDNQARRAWNFEPNAEGSDWIFRLPPLRKPVE